MIGSGKLKGGAVRESPRRSVCQQEGNPTLRRLEETKKRKFKGRGGKEKSLGLFPAKKEGGLGYRDGGVISCMSTDQRFLTLGG